MNSKTSLNSHTSNRMFQYHINLKSNMEHALVMELTGHQIGLVLRAAAMNMIWQKRKRKKN